MKLPFGLDAHKEKDPIALKISYSESNVIDILSERLTNVLEQLPATRQVVIVCVGTDRSTGDALGPLVGTHLHRIKPEGCYLYGTLDEPVHAMNLNETMDAIITRFPSPFIIAIDACLGQLTSVGCIQLGMGPVKPGAGVNKDLPPVGDIHMTGIVNVGGFMEYFVLQNTRLSLVMNMAETISTSIALSLRNLKRYSAASIY